MTKSLFTDTTKYPSLALFGLSFPLLLLPILMYCNSTDKVLIYFLSIIEVILLISTYYMYKLRFNFVLSTSGLKYKLNGFSTKEYFIPLEEIESLNMIALDYTTKFGGWGYRKNKNGEAFVFNDGMFLEVQTANKKIYLSVSDTGKAECISFVSNCQTVLKQSSKTNM